MLNPRQIEANQNRVGIRSKAIASRPGYAHQNRLTARRCGGNCGVICAIAHADGFRSVNYSDWAWVEQ